MSRTYIALIADAVDSRRLPPKTRARLQAELRAALPELNRRYRPALAARFDLTLGDELQCLLHDARAVWEISHHLRHRFTVVDWIIACGLGPITTRLAPAITAPKVDGPCFHLARAALESAKRERRIIAFGGFPNGALSGCAAYYSALYWSWTARQRDIATTWRAGHEPGGRLHPSALSHLRRRMAWPLVQAGDKMFQAVLEAS
jgi:SatD family protein